MKLHASTYSMSLLETLRQIAQGQAWQKGQADYEDRRCAACWNERAFARFPEYIVRPYTADGVAAVVRLARERGMSVALRSGGHSFSGAFLHEEGILLDLSGLHTLAVDAVRRLAVVGPGVTSRELSDALASHGLGFSTGHTGSVGLSGFLLGGGLGINFGAWGPMSTFQIKSLEVVTADGCLRHVSADENPDLFWAARGGGPCLFFAVVLFELNCHPLPEAITARSLQLPLARLADALHAITEASTDSRLQTMLAVVPAPDAGFVRNERVVAVTTLAFAGDSATTFALHDSVIALLQPWALAAPSAEQATGFGALHGQGDMVFGAGRYCVDNILTDQPKDAARILLEHLPSLPSEATLPLLIWRGDPAIPEAAYSARGRWYFSTYARWSAPDDDDANRNWLKSLYDELRSVATNCYINEFDLERRAGEAARCFSPESWSRLSRLRKIHDPTGIFLHLPLDSPA